MAPVKVYGNTIGTNVIRVLIVLEELGVEYELVHVDFATLEHKSPKHLERNPFGQVPAFEDGDVKLFESRAIARYLARKYKTSKLDLLRSDNLEECASVDLWIYVEANHFDRIAVPIFRQMVIVPFFFKVAPDQKLVDESVEKLKIVLDIYEERLSHNKYLAGDFFSMADLFHAPITIQIMFTPYASVIESRPHVKAWWEDISSRPSVKKFLGNKII